ncbi:DUF5681 domain-containing protein [Rhodoblastus sp.]|uniref:DUF5681 domain-containing protein n=1 Tax=Rhodoblastus sp. TaxID=1962975 RepID=UPI003F9C1BCA
MKHTNESGDRQVADEDYAVGYGRPPKDHQFKKGRSGNPAGRPKRKDEGRLKMIDVLMEPRAAKINGKTRRMPAGELLFRAQMEKAFQGNSPATKMLLDLMLKWGVLDTTVGTPAFDVSGAKEALLRKFELACRTAPNAENAEKN